MRDSSEDGSDAEGGSSSSSPIPTRTDLGVQRQQQFCDISMFQPVLGRNTFQLSSEDDSHLRLACPWSGLADDVITMIVLGCDDVLTLLGTYTFIVVHGSILISPSGLARTPIVFSHQGHSRFRLFGAFSLRDLMLGQVVPFCLPGSPRWKDIKVLWLYCRV